MRPYTALYCIATLAVCAITTHVSSSAVVGPEMIFTNAALLSGGLEKCPTYNASTCTHGIAAVAARRRVLTAQGIKTLVLPSLQRTSIFTKMHPFDWGVNFHLLPKLGIRTAVSAAFFGKRHFAMAYQTHSEWDRVVENSPLLMSLERFFGGVLFDEPTRIQVLSARLLVTPIATMADTVLNSLFGAKTLSNGFLVHSIVLVHDTTPAKMLDALKSVNAAKYAKYDLLPTIICRFAGSTDSVTRVNNTWLVELKTSSTALHRLRIHEDPTDTTKAINVSIIIESLALPPAMIETPEYRADQALIKIEHDKAVLSNPYMGTIAGPMADPKTIADGSICMAQECPMGNLFADGIRHAADADIGAFSGPWMIGDGWPAGNITLRDLYGAYPYTEQISKGTYLGLTLFELFNHTIAAGGFDPNMPFTNVASHHLLQISGVRVKFTFTRDAASRLVSINIMNKATGLYEPLQRLKLYTMAYDSYVGRAGILTKLYLGKARYTGEVGATDLNMDLHRALGAFVISRNKTYTPGVFGRLVNVSGTANLASMAEWNQAQTGCPAGMIINASINTCTRCPDGFEPAGLTKCQLVPPPGPLLSSQEQMILIIAAVAVFLIAAAAAVKGVYVWRRYQRLRYCPRDGAAPIAAFFVTVRNEVAMRERHPTAADAVLRHAERVVVDTAAQNQCYVARKLKAHFLVVAQDSAAAVKCAAAIYRTAEAHSWENTIVTEELKHAQQEKKAMTAEDQRRKKSYRRSTRPSALSTDRTRTTIVSHSSSVASPRGDDVRHKKGSITLSEITDKRTSNAVAAGNARGSLSPNATLHVPPQPKNRVSVTLRTAHETVTSDNSGSHRSHRKPTVLPSISIGLAFGYGRVEYDDEVDVYSYSGPVTEAAVTVADLCRGGQVLATEAFATDAGKHAVNAVEFEEFTAHRTRCPLTSADVEVVMMQCNVVGCQQRSFEAKGSDSDEAAGSLAAALETAAGGLTARRIGVVSWLVPALRGGKGAFGSRADHLKAAEEVFAALKDLCGSSDQLISASDGMFTAVVNGATARTAQVAVSTVDLARSGLTVLEEVSGHRVACGACIGTSVTGTCADSLVIAGTIAERARLLAAAAYHHPSAPELLVSEETIPELEGRFALAAIDVIAWPVQCRGMNPSKRTVANPDAIVVYAVENAMKADDDEWLYQLEAAAQGNPHTDTNRQLLAAIGRGTMTEDPATSSPGGEADNDERGVLALISKLKECSAHSLPTLPQSLEKSALEKPPLESNNDAAPSAVELFGQRQTILLCYPFQ